MVATSGGKVTVAPAERSEKTTASPAVDRPQTVSSGNGGHSWATKGTWDAGAIEGIAEGIQVDMLN